MDVAFGAASDAAIWDGILTHLPPAIDCALGKRSSKTISIRIIIYVPNGILLRSPNLAWPSLGAWNAVGSLISHTSDGCGCFFPPFTTLSGSPSSPTSILVVAPKGSHDSLCTE